MNNETPLRIRERQLIELGVPEDTAGVVASCVGAGWCTQEEAMRLCKMFVDTGEKYPFCINARVGFWGGLNLMIEAKRLDKMQEFWDNAQRSFDKFMEGKK
jgi:hypothetical protein